MQVFITSQWRYYVYSFALGVVLGVFYDIVCMIPYYASNKKRYSIIGDLIFSLVVWGSSFITAFSFNSGIVRVYAISVEFASFMLYHITIGSFVRKVEWMIYEYFSLLISKFKNCIDIFIKFVKIEIYRVYNKYFIRCVILSVKRFKRRKGAV